MDWLMLMIWCYSVKTFLKRETNASWYICLYAVKHKWNLIEQFYEKKKKDNMLVESTLCIIIALDI